MKDNYYKFSTDPGTFPQKRVGISNTRYYCGTGRVIIPSNVEDRDAFVESCYRTTSVSIMGRGNLDIMHNVDVDSEVMERLKFPETSDTLGSSVFWVNVPVYNKAVIVSKLNNPEEIPLISENEFSFIREGKKGVVSIVGTGKRGEILINVTGFERESGKLLINVGNALDQGEFKVTVSGSFDLNVSDAISTKSFVSDRRVVKDAIENIETFSDMTFETIESRIKEGTSGYKIEEESFEMGDATVTATIAEETEAMFHSILDELGKTTVTTSIGPSPLLNAAQLLALKTNTTKIFSKYLKIQ